jgi:hypothetical protein
VVERDGHLGIEALEDLDDPSGFLRSRHRRAEDSPFAARGLVD